MFSRLPHSRMTDADGGEDYVLTVLSSSSPSNDFLSCTQWQSFLFPCFSLMPLPCTGSHTTCRCTGINIISWNESVHQRTRVSFSLSSSVVSGSAVSAVVAVVTCLQTCSPFSCSAVTGFSLTRSFFSQQSMPFSCYVFYFFPCLSSSARSFLPSSFALSSSSRPSCEKEGSRTCNF